MPSEGAKDYPALRINVTGPGGILADLIRCSDVDTTLLRGYRGRGRNNLILVYRSPFLWLIPLLAAGMALSAASAVVSLHGQERHPGAQQAGPGF